MNNTLPRNKRLNQARKWLKENGKDQKRIIHKYRKKFKVDIMCAIKELQILGVELNENDIKGIKKNEEKRIKRRQIKKKELEDRLFESDEDFAFIAGYTSWGFPYGIQWDEMKEEH